MLDLVVVVVVDLSDPCIRHGMLELCGMESFLDGNKSEKLVVAIGSAVDKMSQCELELHCPTIRTTREKPWNRQGQGDVAVEVVVYWDVSLRSWDK